MDGCRRGALLLTNLAKLSRKTTSFAPGWIPFGSYSTCTCTLPFGWHRSLSFRDTKQRPCRMINLTGPHRGANVAEKHGIRKAREGRAGDGDWCL